MAKWWPKTEIRGGTRWVEKQPGHWVDLGPMTGPELVKWCFLNRIPLPGYARIWEPVADKCVPLPDGEPR